VVASFSKHLPADGPAWLDQVLGVLSPPFSFRNGGSAVTGGGGSGKKPGQQSAASEGSTKRGQRG